MAKYQFIIIAAVVVVVAAVLAIGDAGEDLSLIQTNYYPEATCRGSIAECLADGELEMDSEIHRRMLVTTKSYIGYGALKPDHTPCPYKGSSYYKCNKNGKANPYTRNCYKITKCSRGG